MTDLKRPFARTMIWASLALLGCTSAQGASLPVTNCSDAGPGSLRNITASAHAGDTIVLNAATMNCSTISLSTGAISTPLNSLTISGSGASTLQIRSYLDRVIAHHGTGTLTLSGVTLTNGSITGKGAKGGCLYSSGNLVISDSVVTGCQVKETGADISLGGAVYVQGSLALTRSEVSNSMAIYDVDLPTSSGAGGGGLFAGDATIQFSTITGNLASTEGGGVLVGGNLTVLSSTVAYNVASFGAGIADHTTANLVVTNSTVSNNLAALCSGIYAGGVAQTAVTGSTLTLSNSTVALNQSQMYVYNGKSFAAGVCASSAGAQIRSSILSNNVIQSSTPQPSDLSADGGAITGDHDLIQTTVTGTAPPTGTLTGDPMLQALADNGGTTQTLALRTGSAAIGVGSNPLRLSSDQRGTGYARMTKEKTDIGAYQTGDGIFASGFESN
jgi:hypothetical protein